MKKFALWSLILAFTSTVVWLGYTRITSTYEKKNQVGLASIIAVHHLGHDYDISKVFVNKADGGFAGRDGGGAAIFCCIMIPSHWRPGVNVEVRWAVGDWSRENRAEVDVGNYQSLSIKGMYIANVPVEKYDAPGDIYVHFFPKGRVRVVSSMYSVLSPSHPIRYGPGDGGYAATAGSPVKAMLTPDELDVIDRRGEMYGDD